MTLRIPTLKLVSMMFDTPQESPERPRVRGDSLRFGALCDLLAIFDLVVMP
jgi:hypothetical protein